MQTKGVFDMATTLLYIRGNLVRKPVLKSTAAGTLYALGRIAESVMRRNGNGEYVQQGRTFHNIIAYGDEAARLADCEAGQQLVIEGRMNTDPRFAGQFIIRKLQPGLRKGERYAVAA